jgi:endonuclease YncB( thermonuclease family)
VKDIEDSDNFGRLVRYVIVDKNTSGVDNVFVNKWVITYGYLR